MPRSKLDPSQIQQHVYDETNEALKVSLTPIEMAIELDANDGDSVLVIPKMQVIDADADQIIDTSMAKRMSVSADCTLSLIIEDIEILAGTISAGEVREICIPQIKLSQACKVVLQS